MIQKNGYVQLEIKDKEAYIIYHPPISGGDNCDIKEVESYIIKQGFTSFSVQRINDLIENKEEKNLLLGESKYDFFSGTMDTETDEKGMIATSRIYPPSVNGPEFTKEDIIASLKSESIRFGIDEEAINNFLENPIYFTDVIFAKGQLPKEGTDGEGKFYFNTNTDLKPKKNEDGSVDFHSLNMINEVNEGDLLCEVKKEIKGTNGTDLFGRNIEPKKVKVFKIECGKNVSFNEERTKIYADVTGHVFLKNGIISVSDVYTITGDVDNSTGNIDYKGNVTILGSIKTGFSVKSGGDIVVNGVIEDATVRASGHIIVKRGINAKGKGDIAAEGNIISKFIENCNVKAGGYVESGVILTSHVEADGDVVVGGSRGNISGSTVISGGSVKAKTIGTDMGAKTLVAIGQKPMYKAKYEEIRKSDDKLNEKIQKFSGIMSNYQKSMKKGAKLDKKTILYLKELAVALSKCKELLSHNNRIKNEIDALIKKNNSSKIVIEKDIYPGCTIILSGVKKNIDSKLSSCQFKCVDGVISKTII